MKIINNIYEYQELIIEDLIDINNVCNSKINPIDIGWFIIRKSIFIIVIKKWKINCIISRNSLLKILILEINDKENLFSWCFKRKFLILIYKTNVFIKLLKLMINLYLIIYVFIFVIGCFIFISNRKHLLSILLCLEYIVLRLFIILFIYLIKFNYEYYILLIFLVFSVCEGALGLSILVSIIRTHGNDYFQSFNVLC